MYLLIDVYGVVYKASNISITLKDMSEEGDITIVDIRESNSPKVLVDDKWLDIELREN